jgi:hypothetical protein
VSDDPRCPRCGTAPRTLVARFRLGHEAGDATSVSEALRDLEVLGVVLDAEPWVQLACVCGARTVALPAADAHAQGLIG